MSGGRAIPAITSSLTDEAVCFAIDVVDSSGVAERLEALLVRSTGRRRALALRALLVALLLLALDDRPLHLKAATRLLFCSLSPSWRTELGVVGEAGTKKALLARYRCVRHLFHLAISVMDPSCQAKNRVISQEALAALAKELCEADVILRRERLESVVGDLIEASVKVCSKEELERFDGAVGLDATVVPLFSRGPSARAGTSSSDPDGGWYVREGDHRDVRGPKGKQLRKLFWADEATIVTMGRPAGAVPAHPNLVPAACLTRPGEDPGGTAVRLLTSVRRRGYRAGYLGADRAYSQARPERFHLPVRALGYSVVMDYKGTELGRQANSAGAVMVDGAFYCPSMPEDLVSVSTDLRAGTIDAATHAARIAARGSWRLVRKEGPDKDGYERFACPAQGGHPHLCCPLRPAAAVAALGQIPVLSPPVEPPKVCTQSAVTIAPGIGARHRQDLAYGSPEHARVYATYPNTIEGTNGYLKDPAHEARGQPGRRRVRGIARPLPLRGPAPHGGQLAQDRRLPGPGRQRRRTQGGRAGPTSPHKPHRLPAAAGASRLIEVTEHQRPNRRVRRSRITLSSAARAPIGPPRRA
jgi:hypothetical protein